MQALSNDIIKVELGSEPFNPLPKHASDLRLALTFSHVEDISGEKSPSHPQSLRIILTQLKMDYGHNVGAASVDRGDIDAGDDVDVDDDGDNMSHLYTCHGINDPLRNTSQHISTQIPLFKEDLSLEMVLYCMNRHNHFQGSILWKSYISSKDLKKKLNELSGDFAEFIGCNPNMPFGECSGVLRINFNPLKKAEKVNRSIRSVSFSIEKRHLLNYMDYQTNY